MPSTLHPRLSRSPLAPSFRSNQRALLLGGCSALLLTPAHADQPIDLPPINVSAPAPAQPMIGEGKPEGYKDYLITRSSTGSKAELPNSFVPQHVTTIPHKIIEEQASRTITDALQNVSGVSSPYPGYYPLDQLTSLYIRGFQVSTTLRDGLWDPTPFGNAWIGNLERIEVLKGPSALLYGAYSGDIGGAVNLVTKKPLSDPHAIISSEFDSYGTHSVSADLSTPLADNKDWLVRLNMHEGGHRLFADDTFFEKRHISGMLQGQLTAQDAITFEAEYRWQNTHPYSGQPGYVSVGSGYSAVLAPLSPTSRDINLYDPRSTYRYRSDALRAVYEHRFDNDWSFKSSAQYTLTSRDTLSITATPSLSNGAEKFTQSIQEIRMGPVYAVDIDQMLHGRFSTFGFAHDLVFGGRFTDSWYKMDMRKPTNSFSSYYFTDPNYPNWGIPALNSYQYYFGDVDTHQFNEYINDVVSLTDKLRLSAGVDFVQYRAFSESGMNPLKMSNSKSRGNGAGWRVGLLYDFVPGFTAYSGYSTTFKPQSPNTTNDGAIQVFDPLKGDQIEFGVKADLTDKLSGTASIYQIELANVTTSDPDPTRATNGYKVQTGKQRSRGVEIDASYKIAPGWNFLLAYGHTDVRIVSDSTYLIGSRTPFVPQDTLRLWSVYEVQSGPFAGLGVGGGMRYVGSRTTNLVSQTTPNLVATLGAYATFDALAYYKYENAKLSVNVRNLFDAHYKEASPGYSWLFPSEPLNATLRLDVTF